MLTLTFSVFVSIASGALGADVLVVHPIPVYSHTVPFRPIFEELAARGHNVSIITPLVGKLPGTAVKEVYMNLTDEVLGGHFTRYLGNWTAKDSCNGLTYEMLGMSPICEIFANILTEYVRPHLPPRSANIDLVVVEPYFCQEWAVGLGAYYNAPVVATLPQPLTPFIAHSLGNPVLSSYIPNFRLGFNADMSFLERVKNTIVDLFEIFWFYFYQVPKMDTVMRGMLGNDLPPLSELIHGVALVLSEAHFSLDYHRPYHRNVVQVGALTVDMQKPISKELESFMNDAEEGVIYFSWGSHFVASEQERTLKVLMGAFSRLKQRVIFKWHTKDVPNVSSNVLVQTWLPQTEILKHKKLRLFISHCGLNSIHEAGYFGVPVVGTPQFGDQHQNSRLLEFLGMGVTVSSEEIFHGDTLYNAIQRVLTDPSFSENAKKRMEIMRDRPMTGVEEAAYWMEYVLKFGADSLRPASTRMPWYKTALLDVFLFILLVLLLAVSVLLLLLRRLLAPRSLIKKKKD